MKKSTRRGNGSPERKSIAKRQSIRHKAGKHKGDNACGVACEGHLPY